MPLVFTVTNTGKLSVTLQLMGRVPTADFQVTDPQGRLVWSRLRGQTLLGALRLFLLAAGKSLTFRHIWNQRADTGRPVSPGEYLIRGVLLTDDPKGMASPPASFRVLS